MAENALSLSDARALASPPPPAEKPEVGGNAISLSEARALTKKPSDSDKALAVIRQALTPKGMAEAIKDSTTMGLAQGVRSYLIKHFGSERQREEQAALQEATREEEHGRKSFVEGLKEVPGQLKEVGKSLVKDPLTTGAIILTQMAPDLPLFGVMGEVGVPARVARVTQALAKAEKASKAVTAAAGAAEGFTVGAAGEAGKQYAAGGVVSKPGEAASAGGQWAIFDAGARTLGLLRRKKGEAPPKVDEEREFVNVPSTALVPTEHENIEARGLFENDAEYGDYLALEHSQRAEAPAREAQQKAIEDTRVAVEGVRKEVNGEGEPKRMPYPAIRGILEKDPASRTPEERAALKKWQITGQMGLVGGAGIAYALANDETQRDMAAAGVMIAAPFEGGRAFGPVLQGAKYGSRVLERLPKNKIEFKKEFIRQEMNRADVSKAEKETLQKILERHGGESIGAAELMKEFAGETGKFELTPVHTEHYAEYGLENIGRSNTEGNSDPGEWMDASPEERQIALSKEVWARTTVYRLPEEWRIPPAGHFEDLGGNQFGHTRSFKEEGVTHVVEMQSDLLQHQKELTPEERTRLEGLRDILERDITFKVRKTAKLEETLWSTEVIDGMSQAARERLHRELKLGEKYVRLRLREIDAQLKSGETSKGLAPIAKNWWRRLVQEELAAAGKRGEGKVLFASADTVAKVERWPMTPREHPGRTIYGPREFVHAEHRSIYDRYRDEITKYLKSLGGKEVTDNQGHTWISVITPGGPPRMYGFAQAELLAIVAGAGLGYAIGAQDKESPIRSDLIGIALGVVAGRALGKFAAERMPKEGAVGRAARGAAENLPPGKAKDAARKMAEKIPGGEKAPEVKGRVRIKEQIDAHQHAIARVARQVMQTLDKVMSRVPDLARRIEITKALDGEVVALSKSEREAFEILKEEFRRIGNEAVAAGVLDELRENYVTHLIKRGQEDKLAAFLKQIRGAPTMSPTSPFAKQRLFPTIKELEAAGLELVSKDAATIYSKYAFAMNRTIANKNLLNALLEDTRGIFIPAASKDIPANFKTVDRPLLQGMKVHPDIVPELSFLFDTREPDAWVKAVSALSTTAKRAEVSFSLFHAMSLTQAYVASQAKIRHGLVGAAVGTGAAAATGNDPYVGGLAGTAIGMIAPLVKNVGMFITGRDTLLKQLKEGGKGDIVDEALRDGLRISPEKTGPVVTDVAQDFYSGLEGLQGVVDKYIHPVAGKAVGQIAKWNHFIDNLMWGRLHAGMKLQVYLDKKTKLIKENATAHDRIPETPLMSEAKAGEIAASYANSLFGGLNWTKLMEGVEAKHGREIAAALTSPTGMRYLNLLTFAPDWTISTTLSAIRAADLRPSQVELASLHRQYMVRAALYTFAAAEAINYSQTGKHLWDEDDPTVVHLGDGSTMQLSKHFFEPFQWGRKPAQEALNKLGVIPSEGIEQLTGDKYLSTKGAPKMKGMVEHVEHLGKRFLPFGATGSAMGTLGLPVYSPKKPKKKASELLEDAAE